ncbi:hypothetical protein HMPREF9123_2139 [Neisseria bacilliformis ATCC BAA-1200]|uniref:Uncharacterized protein n=1 Tax=Neisseria bacilliformis ATCC BAA-1200 TaxID=888742 RepID=F2BEI3_9NEIS|nr:hypothetical protein HMPREF9123_2139 [Neisseria bacilliformis ATCC BAA-1200]
MGTKQTGRLKTAFQTACSPSDPFRTQGRVCGAATHAVYVANVGYAAPKRHTRSMPHNQSARFPKNQTACVAAPHTLPNGRLFPFQTA